MDRFFALLRRYTPGQSPFIPARQALSAAAAVLGDAVRVPVFPIPRLLMSFFYGIVARIRAGTFYSYPTRVAIGSGRRRGDRGFNPDPDGGADGVSYCGSSFCVSRKQSGYRPYSAAVVGHIKTGRPLEPC
jgi:hypothetical protein